MNERKKDLELKKNELFKSMNHNLRTPLNGIVGVVGKIKKNY